LSHNLLNTLITCLRLDCKLPQCNVSSLWHSESWEDQQAPILSAFVWKNNKQFSLNIVLCFFIKKKKNNNNRLIIIIMWKLKIRIVIHKNDGKLLKKKVEVQLTEWLVVPVWIPQTWHGRQEPPDEMPHLCCTCDSLTRNNKY
jgi:hypothetical protein